ncbi:hypothetical protein [Thalassotalea piscium]|uniref:Uncharacterized protein YehS (DUF1456 family) n=1 Tax=Thalassotalea piscium TaxID=1230533 RepID=A0A7X0TTG5_9GAMM|nr:hypothetical protein [Thalassotalea piscium]MBB6543133.1 uncharacterized protein YehS (DUF1456 family) [Thalassotalea piscium]
MFQLNKDKELIIDILDSKGWDISKSKLKAWETKTGTPGPGYREMPRGALDDFIEGLYDRRLVNRIVPILNLHRISVISNEECEYDYHLAVN